MGSPACTGHMSGSRDLQLDTSSAQRFSLRPLGPLPGTAAWNGSQLGLLVDSICFPLQVCPKAMNGFAEGPTVVLHKVFFPDILEGHPCLMSTLPWAPEACKEGAARQASSQAAASLLRKWLLCRPQFYRHCAWHAASMSVCAGEHGGTLS